jgi:dipeptidyl-peptidase 4
MKTSWGTALVVGLVFVLARPAPAQPLLTVAERSDYKATARHAEVVEYCEQLAKMSPLIRLAELGVTQEGRKLPLVILADPPVAAPEEAAKSGKLVVFAMGNIHAGEVDGKEALLMLMRDLAFAKERPLLKDLVLLFVPNFNADGGDRMAKTNRPYQNGPPEVGIRPNAQGFDLNRDYTKLESPEVRALVRFFNRWDPALIVDCHTTNGSYHDNAITFDGPRHPACDVKLVDFTRDELLPDLAKRMKTRGGYLANYYGNFTQGSKIWETYPAQPRYGTQYVGLRHRIGILCESYVYASYKDRVLASRDFVLSCFEYAAQHKDMIGKLLKDAEKNSLMAKVALRHKLVPLGKELTIVGIEGGKTAPPGKTKEFVVTYLGKCEPTVEVPRPYAYVVPQGARKVIDTLLQHGITAEELKEEAELPVEVYRIEKMTTAAKAFQEHKLVTVVAEARKENRRAKVGDVVVRTAQPLGTLAAFLLEPQSEDGFCTWNFFDGSLREGGDYPVLRVPAMATLKTQRLPAPGAK